MQTFVDFYTNQLQLDTCRIFADDNGSSTENDNGPSFVTAGPITVINSPSGTWFTIPQNGIGFYEADDQLPGALPIGATLSIPGDEFPSVGAIPLETPPVPVRISPINDVLTGDDEFVWVPEGGMGVSVRIDIFVFDGSEDFQRFFGACIVTDDGEFEMPADVLSAMAIASPDNMFTVRYSRTISSLGLAEGVVVFSSINVAK